MTSLSLPSLRQFRVSGQERDDVLSLAVGATGCSPQRRPRPGSGTGEHADAVRKMPVLDGLQATRLIKANEATQRARVIAYTSNLVSKDTVAQELFAAVLQKPATPAAILAIVEHVVSL